MLTQFIPSVASLLITPSLHCPDKSAVPRECQQSAAVAVGKGEGGRGGAVGRRAAALGKARGDETKGGEREPRGRRRWRPS